jgi:hypothetical protein
MTGLDRDPLRSFSRKRVDPSLIATMLRGAAAHGARPEVAIVPVIASK